MNLSGRSLTGAVRATAAITIAITGRSLKRGRQARPLPLLMQLPRGGCSLSAPAPLSQPGVRLAAVSACSPGNRHHFRVQHRPSHRFGFCGGAPLTPAPGDLCWDLRWAAGRACAQGERARAREAARCGRLLPQPRSCCTPLLLARFARACRGEACHLLGGWCDRLSAVTCRCSSGEGSRTA